MEELGHKQLPTPTTTDNYMASCIENNTKTIKQQRSWCQFIILENVLVIIILLPFIRT